MNISRLRIEQKNRDRRSLFVNRSKKLIHENQEYRDPIDNMLSVLAGMLIGALAMLLLAPQSGKDTRTKSR